MEINKKCESCGDTFVKSKSKSWAIWEKRRFCSVRCSNTHKEPWNKGIKYDEHMKNRLNLSGLKIGHGLFKGKKRPEHSGKNHPNWKEKIIKQCKGCEQKLSLAPWESKRLFCNIICYGLWHRGSNSPVFVGDRNKKNLRNVIMELPEYKNWRKAIFLRDDFTCCICNERGGHLDADHYPEPYWSIRDRLNIKNAQDARDCKEFWDISLGRTLCRECHRKTENYMKNPKKSNPK